MNRFFGSFNERVMWFFIIANILSFKLFAIKNYASFRIHQKWTIYYFWGWPFFYLLIIGGGISGIGWLMMKLTNKRVTTLIFSSILICSLSLIIGLNQSTVFELLFQSGHWSYIWGMRLNLFLIFTGLVLLSIPMDDVFPGLRLILTVSVCITILLFVPFDLRKNSYQLDGKNERNDSAPLVVIGIDGADWDLINKLTVDDQLKNLDQIKSNGVWGKLGTIQPTDSPVIWTTIATGRSFKDHGINGFTAFRIPGLSNGLTHLEFPRGFGYFELFSLLPISRKPINNHHRLEPAYWNIATVFKEPMTIINWWNTWPVDSIEGRMVSDRIHYRTQVIKSEQRRGSNLTHPPELMNTIADVMFKPDELRYETVEEFMNISRNEFQTMKKEEWRHHQLKNEFPYIYSMYESNRRIALRLLKNSGKESVKSETDLFVLFRMIDLVSHSSMKYSNLVNDHGNASNEQLNRYGQVLSRSYRAIDRMIGDVRDHYERPNLLVVSDHGFEKQNPSDSSAKVKYDHDNAPKGIFLASGPAFNTGKIENIDIYDILPNLLYLKGLPLSKELEGNVRQKIFSDEFNSNNSIEYVDSYPRYIPSYNRRPSPEVNQKIEEHLDSLGYL